MALKSTIFKVNLGIADMDRPHYGEHQLTLAKHPSETDARLMARLLAFAMYADEHLEFGRGISTDDEPALWLKDYSGVVRLWIEVGLPDVRLVRKASSRADAVVVLAYGGREVDVWWSKNGPTMERLNNLRVLALDRDEMEALSSLAERNMTLQCTIQDGDVWLTNDTTTSPVAIVPRRLLG